MELNTVDECDVALHYLDNLLGEHQREFDEAIKIADANNQKAAIALNQRNITRNEMATVELRKKELCEEQSKALLSSNVNSSRSNGARSAIDLLGETQTTIGADLKSMVTD